MSRIGKLPITVPAGVTVTVDENNFVTVKGPKGTLTQQVNPIIKINQEGNVLTLTLSRKRSMIRPLSVTVCRVLRCSTASLSMNWKRLRRLILLMESGSTP